MVWRYTRNREKNIHQTPYALLKKWCSREELLAKWPLFSMFLPQHSVITLKEIVASPLEDRKEMIVSALEYAVGCGWDVLRFEEPSGFEEHGEPVLHTGE